MKDFNYFFDNISLHGTLYPFDRAEKFNKNISRLGVTKDGLTYLDQYRILISQIGNALAYVRMVRAGGLHYCLGSSVYLPSHDLSTFSTQYLAQSTSKAVVCFHQILTNMFHNLNGGSDYFKLLVDVFINIFYSPENSHLKLFVMIIPPLTINFVRYIVAAKEKMSKRNRDGAFFTDDGFAMVLDLNEEFDAIHWFESVREKYKQEELLVLKRANCESKEFNHENTVKLSTKRLHVYRQVSLTTKINGYISIHLVFLMCNYINFH
ncbi:hypothetical protein AAG570_012932 [Ranatra chinensis]|uniref:Uncharacterized protein n=1 Tax=Ranatra chinensis TaxID=642074 RepID=A0ABD0Z3K7_9HEMI